MGKIKDFIKSNFKVFLGIIIGILVTSGVVYAAVLINAGDVTYSPEGDWNITDVKSALDDLYSITGGIPNDVKNYLKIGNINKDYTSITQVLEDTETLQTLINNDRACNYLKDSNDWVSLFTSNESAMEYIGLNNYCANTLLDDSTWLEAIANSTYFEKVLNVKVPFMTSNTIPSGEVFGGNVNSNTPAYYAFDNNMSTIVNNDTSVTNNFELGYKFTKPTKIYLATLTNRTQDPSYPLKDFTIKGSHNGSTYYDLGSNTAPNVPSVITKTVLSTNLDNYLYYKIHCDSSYSNDYVRAAEIQFYGREDV